MYYYWEHNKSLKHNQGGKLNYNPASTNLTGNPAAEGAIFTLKICAPIVNEHLECLPIQMMTFKYTDFLFPSPRQGICMGTLISFLSREIWRNVNICRKNTFFNFASAWYEGRIRLEVDKCFYFLFKKTLGGFSKWQRK